MTSPRHEQITEWRVLPTGCDPNERDADMFAVKVVWRGPFQGKEGGGWAVVTGRGTSELSRGGTWSFLPPKFRRWQHRWESFEEAQDRARAVVDDVQVNGLTFAGWRAHFAAREALQG